MGEKVVSQCEKSRGEGMELFRLAALRCVVASGGGIGGQQPWVVRETKGMLRFSGRKLRWLEWSCPVTLARLIERLSPAHAVSQQRVITAESSTYAWAVRVGGARESLSQLRMPIWKSTSLDE
jgi:hypothetical protein